MTTVRQPQVLMCSAYDVLGLTRLPRVLKAAGCHVTFMGPAGALAGKSRYVDRVCTVSGSTAEVVEALKEHLDDQPEPYRLITVGDDRLLQELSRYRHAPWLRDWFPVDSEKPACDAVVSKAAFAGMAHKAGMPVPGFELCCTYADAENAARSLGFPLVLKRVSGSAGLDVRIVRTCDDLAAAYTELDGCAPLFAQQYIVGRVGSTEVLFNRGKPLCWYSSYSVVCLPAETGPSCVREIMLHTDIEPLLSATGVLTGFHGFGGIDWIQEEKTGRLRLIEFNARPTPGYHFGLRAGVNFSRALTDMFKGDTCTQLPSVPDERHLKIFMFPQDVLLAVHNRDLRSLLQWLPGGPRSQDIPFDDPHVLCVLLKRICSKIVRDAADAIRRRVQALRSGRCVCSA
jgi:predicted ATP-grasp superfamily ATP-dependent carboligase